MRPRRGAARVPGTPFASTMHWWRIGGGLFECRRTSISLRSQAMRALVVIGVMLILFGICTLLFQGVTYFTTERAVDAGPIKVDVQKPHAVVFNPIAGV